MVTLFNSTVYKLHDQIISSVANIVWHKSRVYQNCRTIKNYCTHTIAKSKYTHGQEVFPTHTQLQQHYQEQLIHQLGFKFSFQVGKRSANDYRSSEPCPTEAVL